jgi:hypothetical protein
MGGFPPVEFPTRALVIRKARLGSLGSARSMASSARSSAREQTTGALATPRGRPRQADRSRGAHGDTPALPAGHWRPIARRRRSPPRCAGGRGPRSSHAKPTALRPSVEMVVVSSIDRLTPPATAQIALVVSCAWPSPLLHQVQRMPAHAQFLA